ncbi:MULTISPECIES: CoA-binding protein [unclassified Streptococcus]|uniref:CoA-binding protein n=1 Tax=unclassified Streptococcus TaxID=2608887 RepID=UPI0018AC0C9C|nr:MULTISPECIES: CoA-binding protein [unclassified Streptococcus]MBF8970943.1 CoA-binding protein [Streptococcus sp. NLN76]MBG9367895.1 CoA-binding protein [Streptococcus sp. NLN64]
MLVTDSSTIKKLLVESKTIAIVGLSPREDAVSYRVASYLQEKGYRIVPVNPRAVDQLILGQQVYPSLESLPFPVDIVDVFRRSEFLPDVAADYLKMSTKPKAFWAQLGLFSQEALDMLEDAGVADIMMDRCIKVDHHMLVEDDTNLACEI